MSDDVPEEVISASLRQSIGQQGQHGWQPRIQTLRPSIQQTFVCSGVSSWRSRHAWKPTS